jgi:hypothetical protein
MTNVNFKNMIVCAIALVASVNANAQETKVDTTEVNGVELQAIFQQGTDRGCWHGEIVNGVATKHLCNGWKVAGGVKVASVNSNSEQGSGSSVAFAPTVAISYKHNIFEPELSVAYLCGVKVENQKFNAPEGTFAFKIWNTKHDHKGGLRGFIAPTFTYRDMKSVDFIDLGPEWEKFENPFHGHYFAVGGKVGFGINIGKIVKHRKTTVGANNFFLDIVGHMAIEGELGVDFGQINKMRSYETEHTLKLTTVSGAVKLVIDLP